MDPFLGEIRMVGFGFAPMGWALCNGQLLSIAQNSALFSLLGTTFGGNGTTTFGLPDLQGRVPLHAGAGAELPVYNWGQRGGANNLVLTQQQMPSHSHPATFIGTAPTSASVTVQGSSTAGGTTAPTGNYIGGAPKQSTSGIYVANPNSSTLGNIAGVSLTLPAPAGTVTTAAAGSGFPVSIEPPYLAVYFIIALQGLYPSRS